MSIPNPPAEFADPWFIERNAFDVAVKGELEGRLSAESLDAEYGGDGGSGGGVDPQDVGYDIVIAVGQSNASRTGSPVLVNVYDTPDPRVWQYAAGGTYINQIIRAIDPLEFPAADLGTWVANAMQFSREWVKRTPVNRQVLIVPAAVGGSNMGSWKVGGSLHTSTIALANAAVTAAGAHARVVAFLWIQGEAESVSNVTKAAYIADLDPMIASFRANITGASSAPFVLGSMVPEWRNLPNGSSLQIHAAHVETPSRVANTFFVDGPTGMNEGSGGIHYTAAGQREMGRRMCAALWAPPAVPAVPGAVTGLVATPGNASVALAWSAVTASPAVTDYVIQYKASASGTWLTFSDTTSTTPAATVTGLTNGTPYDFHVRAVNSVGPGAYSSTVSATPAAVTVTLPAPTYLIDARTLGLSDGAAVATWPDLSANPVALDVTQATSGEQPTFRATGLGGAQSVQFDGGDSLATAAAPNDFTLAGVGSYSVVCVFSVTSLSGSPRGLFGLRADASGLFHLVVLPSGAVSISCLNNGGSDATSGVVSLSAPHIVVATKDEEGARLYLDGVAATPGPATANYGSYAPFPLTVGRISDALWKHDGHVGYAAIYPGVLTTTQRQYVETTLMAAFGISA